MNAEYKLEKLLGLSDKDIVDAIMKRDKEVTYLYLYKKCYPIFASVYNRYYTDCNSPSELINEIYVYILTPKKDTGRCKLSDFGFRCTLTLWLKIVIENYCHQLFARKKNIPEIFLVRDDRNDGNNDSVNMDFSNLNKKDVLKILDLMPNERYRELLRLRYLNEKTNEETAELLNLSMSNFYNVHLRAKAQFCSILKMEGLI